MRRPPRPVIHLTAQLILLLVTVLLFPAGTARAHEPFVLVEDPWPPFTYGEAGEPATRGMAVDIIQALFTRLGKEVRLELLPWKRCVDMARIGKVDGVMLTIPTRDREELLHFSEPLLTGRILFFTRKDADISWQSFEDLQKYRIGLYYGAEYSQKFKELTNKDLLDIQRVKSIELNLDKLLADRIDLTPILDSVAQELIRNNPRFQGQFKALDKPLRETTLHLALSKQSPIMELSGKIDQTIREMKEDGTIAAILDKYHTEGE